MNDAHQEEFADQSQPEVAPAEHVTTDLPLQAQLMGSLALVFVLSAIAGLVGYATFDSTSLESSARAKATMYASNLRRSFNPWSRTATSTASRCTRRAGAGSPATATIRPR